MIYSKKKIFQQTTTIDNYFGKKTKITNKKGFNPELEQLGSDIKKLELT